MEIRGLIDEFIEDLVKGQGRSERTAWSYRFDLNQFTDFLEGEGLPPVLASINERVLRQFLTWLGGQHKLRTVARKFYAVRSFLRFCQSYGYGKFPEAWRIRPPRKPRDLPNFLSLDEMDRFLNTPIEPYITLAALWGEPAVDRELRDAVAFRMLAWTGLREGELLGLNVGDVDLPAFQITVRGKGDKQRVVPLRVELKELLAQYIDGADDLARPLFLSSTGKRWRPSVFWHAVRRHADQCGIENVSPHTFRHSFATYLVRQGVDVKTVQELLGHADISTTMIYVHTDAKRKREAVEKLPF